ncbi:MAG TPA: hypothetical protein VLB50_13880 [Ignavibacteriaceae bacterium]|nr:hypothetical protein [Ignavibacteriaceae bacterium]
MINSTKHNAELVLKVIDDFGFGNMGVTLDDLTSENKVIQFGIPPKCK